MILIAGFVHTLPTFDHAYHSMPLMWTPPLLRECSRNV